MYYTAKGLHAAYVVEGIFFYYFYYFFPPLSDIFIKQKSSGNPLIFNLSGGIYVPLLVGNYTLFSKNLQIWLQLLWEGRNAFAWLMGWCAAEQPAGALFRPRWNWKVGATFLSPVPLEVNTVLTSACRFLGKAASSTAGACRNPYKHRGNKELDVWVNGKISIGLKGHNSLLAMCQGPCQLVFGWDTSMSAGVFQQGFIQDMEMEYLFYSSLNLGDTYDFSVTLNNLPKIFLCSCHTWYLSG